MGDLCHKINLYERLQFTDVFYSIELVHILGNSSIVDVVWHAPYSMCTAFFDFAEIEGKE